MSYCHCFLVHCDLCDRGSLYRLIHRPAAGENLDNRRRLRMALDVVCVVLFFVTPLNYLADDISFV